MFNSLKKILPQLECQPGWEEYRQYRQLLEWWQKTVASTTVQHTRLLYLKNKVLFVATSSSARAQELSFQRYYLLKKLNSQLPFTLKDIRFSAAQWHRVTKVESSSSSTQTSSTALRQPFKQASNSAGAVGTSSIPSRNPQAAVREWLKQVEARSRDLPLCPQCSVPTPESELQLWHKCYHCIAQQKFELYRSIKSINNNKIKKIIQKLDS